MMDNSFALTDDNYDFEKEYTELIQKAQESKISILESNIDLSKKEFRCHLNNNVDVRAMRTVEYSGTKKAIEDNITIYLADRSIDLSLTINRDNYIQANLMQNKVKKEIFTIQFATFYSVATLVGSKKKYKSRTIWQTGKLKKKYMDLISWFINKYLTKEYKDERFTEGYMLIQSEIDYIIESIINPYGLDKKKENGKRKRRRII